MRSVSKNSNWDHSCINKVQAEWLKMYRDSGFYNENRENDAIEIRRKIENCSFCYDIAQMVLKNGELIDILKMF